MLTEYDKKEMVCNICVQDMKRKYPNMKGCACRCLGNEFCEDINAKAQKYGFSENWLLEVKE